MRTYSMTKEQAREVVTKWDWGWFTATSIGIRRLTLNELVADGCLVSARRQDGTYYRIAKEKK